MKGAGIYCCGPCLAERPFYGALEPDALAWLGPLAYFLRRTFFKPVCGECGARVSWAAQSFLWRNDHLLRRRRSDSVAPPLAAKLVESRRIESGRRDLGIYDQGVDIREAQPKPAEPKYRLEWDENFSRTGRLYDESGVLLAKLTTGLDYMEHSCVMDSAETVIAQRAAVGPGRDANWIEIFGRTGRCVRPFGLPKWTPIVSVPLYPGVIALSFQHLPARDAIFAVSERDAAYVEAKTPLNSIVFSHGDLFGYCRPGAQITAAHICHDEGSAILSYSDRAEGEKLRTGLLAVGFEVESKPADLGDLGESVRLLHEEAGLLLIASGNAATIYWVGHWATPVSLKCGGEILDGRLSASGWHCILKVKLDGSSENDEGSETRIAYEIWELDFG